MLRLNSDHSQILPSRNPSGQGEDQKSTQWCWTWAIHEKGVLGPGKKRSWVLPGGKVASEGILGTRQPQDDGQLKVWPYSDLQRPKGRGPQVMPSRA